MRNTQGDEAAMFITQALKRSAQLYSDRLATVCQDRERTWSEVEARVAKFAGALRKLGVENGERVAILSLNSDRYYEFFSPPRGLAAYLCRSTSG